MPTGVANSMPSQVQPPTDTTPRILVTGATGLLGRQVMKVLDDQTLHVRGLGFTRANSTIIFCDLIPSGAASRQIQQYQPNIVIHLAGERRPEVLKKKSTDAQMLNVDTTGAIAAACEKYKAWLIYVSTDQVFDGTAPPYLEDAQTNALNEYGRHKGRGEKLALDASPRAAVLRLPQLFGPVENLKECVVSSLFEELRDTGYHDQFADDWQLHYPTWAPDVAGVLRAMVDLHCSGTELKGIFHFQGEDSFTKYEMIRKIAEVSGLSSGVVSDNTVPTNPQRPENAQLSGSRLVKLLGDRCPPRTPFQKGLELCLAPFLEAASPAASSSLEASGTEQVLLP